MSQGADAVEPDVVVSADGVLVVRHENDLSGTTDIASHPEFEQRRRTAVVDGVTVTGWFTEDFTWSELCTLEAREPHPHIRSVSAEVTGQRILRLADVLNIVGGADREVRVVIELKHATYFAALGFDLVALLAAEFDLVGWARADARTVFESFEQTILSQIREAGIGCAHVYLLDESGTAPDLIARDGEAAPTYAEQLLEPSLASLSQEVDGISVSINVIRSDSGPDLIRTCHQLGLEVYCWTLRAEKAFLPSGVTDWRTYFEQVMRSGVDGVFADQPDLALEVKFAVAKQP